jgi:hypothetical protein
MKTAVDWLYEQILLTPLDIRSINKCLEQAKEMEKSQMHKCASFWRGKENEIEKPMFDLYYNETFKSE